MFISVKATILLLIVNVAFVMLNLSVKSARAMPLLGLGTWNSGERVKDIVFKALQIGYRHIDAAPVYTNEKFVGDGLSAAFNEGLVKREEVFVTSKLPNTHHAAKDVSVALSSTLESLNLTYVDLYLMHWPVSINENLEVTDIPVSETWKAMQEMQHAGLARRIGVSNFGISKLSELQPPTEFLQVELHPYLPQQELLEYCNDNGIHVTAYSPLGSPGRPERYRVPGDDGVLLLEDPVVKEIAKEHRRTPAEVLLRFSLDRGCSVIPKTMNETRLQSNLDVLNSFRLSQENIDRLVALGSERPYRFVHGKHYFKPGESMEEFWS